MKPAEESDIYPKPPHYYTLFAQSASALPPPNLQKLISTCKTFTCFGTSYPFSGEMPTMEEYGIPRLDREFDPATTHTSKENLLHLLHSLLANTFQLLRFLEVNPKRVDEKAHDIDLIIRNMAFILNSFRRKQCLYNLIEYLNNKKEQREASKEGLKGVLSKIKGDLNEIIGEEPPAAAEGKIEERKQK